MLTRRMTGWPQLAYQWSKDAQLFVFIVLSLTVFRALLFVVFNDQLSDHSGAAELALAFWTGFRFDAATACSWILLSFLFSLSVTVMRTADLAQFIRYWQSLAFACVGMPILFFDVFFFQTYGEHYNQMVLGFIYDDTQAVLLTIWKEYHPMLWIPLFIALNWGLWKMLRHWMAVNFIDPQHMLAQRHWFSHRLTGAVTTVAMLTLVAWAIRGGVSFAGTPLSLKHAYVTNDTFLNRIIPNPMIALRHVYKGYEQRGGELSSIWPDSIEAAVTTAGLGQGMNLAGADLDQLLQRQAKGAEHPPRHIFVLLMESYSGWTMMPMYADGGFSNGLLSLAREGVYFPNFLPDTRSTTQSLNALVTGMPYVGYYINHQPSAFKEYGTSLAKIFKDMGYRTRFFYGGYVGWQRVDTFIPDQGFDEIHGGGNMAAGVRANEWGVDDEFLFNYVQKHVSDDQPSLNFILTTTSHRPYDLDLAAQGYAIDSLPGGVTAGQDNALIALGHHWYADRELEKFVRQMEAKLTGSLFAITGDHAARINLNFADNGGFYREVVPLVLYGPDVLPARSTPLMTPGGHMDIIPTLVELSAPAGFFYAALGDDLMHKPVDAPSYGLGYIISTGGLSAQADLQRFYPAPGQQQANLTEDGLQDYQRHVSAIKAVAWYRGKKGQFLPEASNTP